MRHVCPGIGAGDRWKCSYPATGATVDRFKAATLGVGHDEYLLNEYLLNEYLLNEYLLNDLPCMIVF